MHKEAKDKLQHVESCLEYVRNNISYSSDDPINPHVILELAQAVQNLHDIVKVIVGGPVDDTSSG
jgi:hypothetical protein